MVLWFICCELKCYRSLEEPKTLWKTQSAKTSSPLTSLPVWLNLYHVNFSNKTDLLCISPNATLGGSCMGLPVPVGLGDLEIRGQDNCDRFPNVSGCWVSWLQKQIKCHFLDSRTVLDSLGGKWLVHTSGLCVSVWVLICVLECMHGFHGYGLVCVYIWRKWSAAGSPSVTEKLFEAFAFDVCPTAQHDLLLCAVGLLVVWWQTTLCAALSFPITFKLKLALISALFVSLSLPVTCWHSGRVLI